MTCEERRDALLLHAAGDLGSEEARELSAHLESGCARCADALAEAQQVLGEVCLALPPVAPSPAVWGRLRERIGGESGQEAAATGRAWLELALAAGIAAVAAAGITAALIGGAEPGATPDPNPATAAVSLAELEDQLAEQDEELERLELQLEAEHEVLALLRSPRLVSADMAAPQEGDARGRVFWDWDDYRCYLHASGLLSDAALPPDREYVLWLFTEDAQRIRVAGFRPDARGDAELYAVLPEDTSPAVRVAVTMEAVAAGPEPAGPLALEWVRP